MSKQLMNTTKSYFKTHWVKHSYFMQKAFILKHVLLILNYQRYQAKYLIELCVGNHITLDGLVNGVDAVFKIM